MKQAKIYFSPAEHQALQELADKNGMKLAPFLKVVIFRDIEKKTFLPPFIEEDLADIKYQIKKYGYNLNQLTRYSHILGFALDEHKPLHQLKELEHLLKEAILRVARTDQ